MTCYHENSSTIVNTTDDETIYITHCNICGDTIITRTERRKK